MKRLFIGLPIQSETALQLVNRWSIDPLLNLNRMVWTNPSNWHVTLFFLGATPESQVADLEQMIDVAFNGVQPFTGRLSGVGVFPEKRKPRVFWMGLEDLQPLHSVYALLSDLLQKNGFLFDPKPLRPHLTLARIKSLSHCSSLESLLHEFQSFQFGTRDINRVTLFEKWLLKVYF